jgi:hypothetical protein
MNRISNGDLAASLFAARSSRRDPGFASRELDLSNRELEFTVPELDFSNSKDGLTKREDECGQA